MAYLIPVQYHNCMYPQDINPSLKEVAGHFDVKKVIVDGNYSLHTEYSYMGRRFDTTLIQNHKAICSSNKRGVPMLWRSQEWASEFADFIKDITSGNLPPSIIEIHPPFSDYIDLDGFIVNYLVFEKR